MESENFENLAPFSVSHSHPLNPKDGNYRLELSSSIHSLSGQSNLSLGNPHGTSTCKSSQSIGVVPYPKPNTMVSFYDAKCEARSVEAVSLSNMNRENIMPWDADSMTTLKAGLAPLNCCNQLVRGIHPARSSYRNSYGSIHNHWFGLSDSRNQGICPYHLSNNRSDLTGMGNHTNG